MRDSIWNIQVHLLIAGVIVLILVLVWPVLSHSSPSSPPAFGGASSVGGTLKKDAAVQSSGLESYFNFKSQVEEDIGLAFGFDFNVLLQAATESLGADTTAGGVARMFGRWGLVGNDSTKTGILVYKLENRQKLGTDLAPQSFGSEIGYIGLTAIPFSDIDWALTNLFWEQHLLKNRLAFVAGIVDVTDYVDVYGMVSPWTGFSNLAFSTNPTIPAPNQGLGVAASVFLTDNLYLLGGLADANGDPTDPGDSFDSFFNTAEYFSHLEFGWVSSYKKRYSDNIHLTAWHADARELAGTPDGWGVAFSFSHLIKETWEPYFRAGYADEGGALWDRMISIGVGYNTGRQTDQVGLGVNWGRPSEQSYGSDVNDQYTVELFYRLQLGRLLAVTPDVQVLFNPAENPEEDAIVVFGLRARLSF